MKIVSVVAARPNFVKLAAVHHALREHAPEIDHTIIHTGQHHDPLFSDVFFDQLHIPLPDYNLGAYEAGEQLAQIGITMENLEPLFDQLRPDVVLVYGDVNGAFAAAFIARRWGIPVVHVEAGLRSFDRSMPEEVNRTLIDHVSELLFVSELSGVENLRHEGITKGVHFVGNTMIDTLVRMREHIDTQERPDGIPEQFGLVTLHRSGNVDTKVNLQRHINFLNEIADILPLVFPGHLRTKAALERYGLESAFSSRVHCLDPLGYLPFLKLLSKARLVLTDSGGVQEESTFLGKKCFTLRKNTERPATIDAGSNKLIDLEREEDREHVLAFASSPTDPEVQIPQIWDGRAGERIVQHLLSFLR